MLVTMLITQLIEKISIQDLERIRFLMNRKFFKEEQEELIDIYESYIGAVVNRSCGKCRSETIGKIQKMLNLKK